MEKELLSRELSKHYNQKVIYVVFVLIFLSNVFCNVDHGTLPGCSNQIKESVNINDVQFGTLGSVVYGGIVVGSVVATGIFSRSSWIKPIIVLTLETAYPPASFATLEEDLPGMEEFGLPLPIEASSDEKFLSEIIENISDTLSPP